MNFRQGRFPKQLQRKRCPELIFLSVLVGLGTKSAPDIDLGFRIKGLLCQRRVLDRVHRIESLSSIRSESKSFACPRPCSSRQLSKTIICPGSHLTSSTKSD